MVNCGDYLTYQNWLTSLSQHCKNCQTVPAPVRTSHPILLSQTARPLSFTSLSIASLLYILSAFWLCTHLIFWSSFISLSLLFFSHSPHTPLWPGLFCWSCLVWTLLDASGCALAHIFNKNSLLNYT